MDVTGVLQRAGLSFLRAFGAAAITYGAGILAAPSLDQRYVLALGAVIGSLAAGFRALQEFVPQLSFVSYAGARVGGYADAFARAFLSSLFAALGGFRPLNDVPDLGAAKNFVVAAVVAALAVALKALHTETTRAYRDSG